MSGWGMGIIKTELHSFMCVEYKFSFLSLVQLYILAILGTVLQTVSLTNVI